MQIGNALKQQIELEEEEMEGIYTAKQSTTWKIEGRAQGATEMDDSASELSDTPALERTETKAESKRASSPELEMKSQEITSKTPSAFAARKHATRKQQKSSARNKTASKSGPAMRSTTTSKIRGVTRSTPTRQHKPVAKSKKQQRKRQSETDDDSEDEPSEEDCDPADSEYQP